MKQRFAPGRQSPMRNGHRQRTVADGAMEGRCVPVPAPWSRGAALDWQGAPPILALDRKAGLR